MEDDPTGFVDPNGAQQKPSWWDIISPPSNNLTLPPLTLANQNGSDPASISANGFSTPSNSSFAKSLVRLVHKTAAAASTGYFWAGVGTGAGAAVAGYFGQVEIAEPLADASEASFGLSFKAAATNFAATTAEYGLSMISPKKALIRLTTIGIGATIGHLVSLPYVDVPSAATNVVGEFLTHETEGALTTLGNGDILQAAH